MLKDFFLYYQVLGSYKVIIILAQALNWNMDFSAILAPPSLFETSVFVDGHDAWVWFWARSVLIIWSEAQGGEGAL